MASLKYAVLNGTCCRQSLLVFMELDDVIRAEHIQAKKYIL